MAAENGSLEIVRDLLLPAPAQSAEPPNIRGFRAVCQFRRKPFVGILSADADVVRRDDEDCSLGRVVQGINLVAAIDGQGAAAEEEKRNISAKTRRDFHQTFKRQSLFRKP